MGYGIYGSGSYSTFGSYSTRSSMRSSSYSPSSRSYASTVSSTRTSSGSPNLSQQSSQKVTQQTTVQEVTTQQKAEQKSNGKKSSAKNAPVPDRLKAQKNSDSKSTEQKTSSSQKSSSKKSSKKSSSQKTSESKQNTTEQKTVEVKTTVQSTNSAEEKASVQNSSTKVTSTASVQKVTEEATASEEGSTFIVYTEGTFLTKKDNKAAAVAVATTEKTADELKVEKEEKRRVIKQKDLHDMELQVTKHPKFLALQDKLNERLSKREGKGKSESKIKAPSGFVTYGLVTIKNTASFLELSLSNEEATLDTLEDIHDLLDKEFVSHNVYKVEAEIGKFLLASKSVSEMVNLAMKIQIKFNEHTWNEKVLALPMFRKLLRPEDLLNDDAVPLFNGPRLSIGVHAGEATFEEDSTGHKRYCGVNIVQVETIGKFAQGGQILISSNAWTKVNQSQLSKHLMNRLGVFKLEDFTTGCSLVEVTPDVLQERAKFYGAVCSHCAKGIQPWEKSFEKLQCTWHVDHFKCFNCGTSVGEGTYASYQGLPHCHSCYLSSNPKPKCKKCMNPIAKDYINALGAYWHTNCFSCKQCRKRPTPENPLRGHKEEPYCHTCYDKIVKL